MTVLLTGNLPLLIGAPNGIKKLRDLILELAVRGKLVPQDPKDEPASELLKRIAEEKARLVADGKIKTQKLMAKIDRETEPFELPESWAWAVLSEVTTSMDSGWSPACEPSPSPSDDVWGVLKTTAVQVLHYLQEENKELPAKLNPRPEAEVKAGDILFTRAGPTNRVGISCLVEETRPRLMISDKIIRFHPVEVGDYGRYVVLCLNSGETARYLENAKSGMAASQVNISQEKLRVAPIPLAPLPEQHRIVAKVDELMALCDRLEARQADADSAHTQLVQALLDGLTQARDAEDFAQRWQRLAEHFHTLFTTESSIDALKQTLLQLAVMGKLVLQDPNDEPAGELLKRIVDGRAAGVDGRKNPKQKVLSSIDPDEKPFELPSNWEWVRLQQVISVSSGDGLVSTSMKPEGGIPVYGGNGVTGYHDKKNVDTETLVIGRVGYYCGSIHLTPARAWITDNALKVIFSEENLYKNFLYWLLKGTNLKEQENATAQPVISGRKIYPIVLAIPPLAEQRRIVAKVDQLMALCDQLKARVNQARQVHKQLANALVEQAVA